MLRKTIAGAIGILVLASWSVDARGELVSCGTEVSGFKVYADGMLETASLSNIEDQHPDLRRLQVILDSVERSVRDLENDLGFHVIRCTERKPSGASDFDSTRIERLLQASVVLEVWGRLDARPDQGGSFRPVAELSYLVIPLKRDAGAEPHLQGYYRIDYIPTLRSGDGTGAAGKPIDHSGEVQPFTALGLGLRHLENQDFALAFGAFCTANRLLADIPSDSPVARGVDLDKLGKWTASTVWTVHELAKSSNVDNSIQILTPEAIAMACKVDLP